MGVIITAGERVATAAAILGDPDHDRWTAEFLLQALCDGQRDIVGLRPDANAKVASVLLAPGTRQIVPASGGVLIEVRRNMGTDGATPGRVITLKKREDLSRVNPLWPTDDPAAEVVNYMYDKRVPAEYEVYPPQPATGMGYVELVHSEPPADILSGAYLTIDDQFAEPLLLFMLSRALSVEGEATLDVAKAEKYRAAYVRLLGGEDEAAGSVEPKGTD